MDEQLLDTWAIHNRINLYLLDAVPADALGEVPATRGGTAGEQFAHLHNVRLMRLKEGAPDLLAICGRSRRRRPAIRPCCAPR